MEPPMKYVSTLLVLLVVFSWFRVSSASSGVQLSLNETSVSVDENVGVVTFCGMASGLMMGNVTATVIFQDNTAQNGTDYGSDDTLDLILSPNEPPVCFTVNIIDDDSYESDEQFSVTLETMDEDGGVTSISATVTIRDNDELVIGWEKTDYTVDDSRDGPDAEVCAIIMNGTLQTSITDIMVDIIPGMNAYPGKDYGLVNPDSVGFNESANHSCVTIPIVDDFLFEDTEELYVSLELPVTAERISLSPNLTRVHILDDDNLILGFSATSYTVEEGDGVAMVQVDIRHFSPGVDVQFIIEVSTPLPPVELLDKSSTIPTPIIVPFTALSNMLISYSVAINISDNDVDSGGISETLTARLMPRQHNERILIDPSEASIVVLDDDMARIGLDNSSYTVAEGDSILVCAQVLTPPTLRRRVTLNITTMSDTATAPEDFIPNTMELVFDTDSPRQCFEVTTQSDGIREGVEFFNISLSSDSSISLETDVAVITILDAEEDLNTSLPQPTETSMFVSATEDMEVEVTDPELSFLPSSAEPVTTEDYSIDGLEDTESFISDLSPTFQEFSEDITTITERGSGGMTEFIFHSTEVVSSLSLFPSPTFATSTRSVPMSSAGGSGSGEGVSLIEENPGLTESIDVLQSTPLLILSSTIVPSQLPTPTASSQVLSDLSITTSDFFMMPTIEEGISSLVTTLFSQEISFSSSTARGLSSLMSPVDGEGGFTVLPQSTSVEFLGMTTLEEEIVPITTILPQEISFSSPARAPVPLTSSMEELNVTSAVLSQSQFNTSMVFLFPETTASGDSTMEVQAPSATAGFLRPFSSSELLTQELTTVPVSVEPSLILSQPTPTTPSIEDLFMLQTTPSLLIEFISESIFSLEATPTLDPASTGVTINQSSPTPVTVVDVSSQLVSVASVSSEVVIDSLLATSPILSLDNTDIMFIVDPTSSIHDLLFPTPSLTTEAPPLVSVSSVMRSSTRLVTPEVAPSLTESESPVGSPTSALTSVNQSVTPQVELGSPSTIMSSSLSLAMSTSAPLTLDESTVNTVPDLSSPVMLSTEVLPTLMESLVNSVTSPAPSLSGITSSGMAAMITASLLSSEATSELPVSITGTALPATSTPPIVESLTITSTQAPTGPVLASATDSFSFTVDRSLPLLVSGTPTSFILSSLSQINPSATVNIADTMTSLALQNNTQSLQPSVNMPSLPSVSVDTFVSTQSASPAVSLNSITSMLPSPQPSQQPQFSSSTTVDISPTLPPPSTLIPSEILSTSLVQDPLSTANDSSLVSLTASESLDLSSIASSTPTMPALLTSLEMTLDFMATTPSDVSTQINSMLQESSQLSISSTELSLATSPSADVTSNIPQISSVSFTSSTTIPSTPTTSFATPSSNAMLTSSATPTSSITSISSATSTSSPSPVPVSSALVLLTSTSIIVASSDISPSPTPNTSSTTSPTTLPSTSPTATDPTVCPSLFSLSIVPTAPHIVEVTLALTLLEHANLATLNSVERCRLEVKIVEAFQLGWISNPTGRRRRRQAALDFDSDLTMIGDLSTGAGVIAFFIINGTVPSSPSYVPAADIVAAFLAANIQELDTYPIIRPARVLGSDVTIATPAPSFSTVLIAVVAGLGGFVCLLLLLVVFILCCICCWNCRKRKTGSLDVQESGLGDGETYSESKDFTFQPGTSGSGKKVQSSQPLLEEEEAEEEMVTMRRKATPVTMTVLANEWAEPGGQRTSKELQVPDTLLERITHYDTTPLPSSPARSLRSRLHNAVAPSPSVSNKSQSSEGVTAPAALLPPARPSAREVEAKRLRQEAVKLQEEEEERILKKRKKDTLERLLRQSQEKESLLSHRKRRGQDKGIKTPSSLRAEPMQDMEVGDIELVPSSTPYHLPTSTSPRIPSSRPHKRKKHHKRHNKVGALPMDASDTVDGVNKPHPHHRSGRNQRARRFSHQGIFIGGGGHSSRGVAFDTQRELAWMDMGDGGVQLMKIQPLTEPTPYPISTPYPGTSATPYPAPPATPHPFLSQTPHPNYSHLPPLFPSPTHLSSTPRPGHTHREVSHPQTQQVSVADEKLPALPTGASFAPQQLHNYFKIHQEMERLGINQTTPTHKSSAGANKTTEIHEGEPDQKRHDQERLDVTDGDKAALGDRQPKEQDTIQPDALPPGHTPAPATPPPRRKTPPVSQESTQQLLQEALGREPEATPTSHPAAITPLLWQQHPAMTTPYQLYSPPLAIPYHPVYRAPQSPRQVLWSPSSEPHPMAPPAATNIKLSPEQLGQLRRHQDYHTEQASPQHLTLPAQSQIRNQTSPFP